MAPSEIWESELCDLLRDDLFAGEVGGLREWLSRLPGGGEIVANLPGPSASAAETIATSLRLLRNRGAIDLDFFHRLTLARPARSEKIATIRALCLKEAPTLPTAGAPSPPSPLVETVENDVTERLLRGVSWVRILAGTEESQPVTCRLLVLGREQTGHWKIDGPFSPPLELRFGPRAELVVPTPHYLSHVGVRKGQRLGLDRGTAQFVLVQAQPSIRRATLSVHRGAPHGPWIRYELTRDLRFFVQAGLSGRVVALSGSGVEARLVSGRISRRVRFDRGRGMGARASRTKRPPRWRKGR